MTRREAWLSAALVFGVALAIRAWAASLVVFPKPEDTTYYVMVARNLLAGDGLIIDAMWSFQTPPLVFPRPAFEVWLPLPSFLAAIPMAILGPTFEAAQWSPVITGAIVAVLAWRLAADVAAERGLPPFRARCVAIGSGLTAAVSLSLVLHSALPDSTMPFAALALGAVLLMARLARRARTTAIDAEATIDAAAAATEPTPVTEGGLDRGAGEGRWRIDGVAGLVGLGLLLGLAALARNEASILALTWVLVVLGIRTSWPERIRLVAIPAVAALAVFVPWAVRDWLVFGSPLPGQAAANAFSITGFDIFAWNDPPTLSRYLAVGPAELIDMRRVGIWHNLWSVLLLPGMLAALIGLLALPWQGRDRALRPLLVFSVITFVLISLVFPVATTWGTFLHAAGPVHVLLIVSALLALDAGLAWLARARRWSGSGAWLGPVLTISAGLLLLVQTFPAFGAQSAETARQYRAIAASMTAAGVPLGPDEAPVISDFPIWLTETTGNRALALPSEAVADVLDLASTFGARLLVMADGGTGAHGLWPDAVDSGGTAAAACFREIALEPPADPELAASFGRARAWSIECR